MSSPATIAICIGHSRRIDGRRDGGAVSCKPQSTEWAYNDALGRMIVERLHDQFGIDAELVNDYQGSGYGAAMRWLAGYLRGLGKIKLAVELHFNSADNAQARGHEWLHWHASSKGKLLAAELSTAFSLAQPKIPARGVKALDDGSRGAEFVRLTHCPAVICEPGFGSNQADWDALRLNPELIALTLATALASAVKRL